MTNTQDCSGADRNRSFDASQGIYEINKRHRKQGKWITRGWIVCASESQVSGEAVVERCKMMHR